MSIFSKKLMLGLAVCYLTGALACRSVKDQTLEKSYPLLLSLPGAAIIMENPKDIPQWERLAYPLKHQALMRLLEIQNVHFGGKPFEPTGKGVGLDSTAVWLKEKQSNQIIIVATPTWKPMRTDAAGAKYFVLEQLGFDINGRLISQADYKE